MPKRVLSGIRATGRLHLGNYLGAVKGMLELQDSPDFETLYMVADVHAITTPYSPEELRIHRREVIIDYLAAGLDPEKSTLFIQSMVPQHLELAFYFSSVVSIARMQHLPTFKDKVKQHPDYATMALLNYPILMAADILIYKAHKVPVGVDQEPHLEIAREIARKMNAEYGLDFPEPTRYKTSGEYVPSLKGMGKMSKSVEGSYIALTDSEEDILERLKGAPTDSGKGKITDQERNRVYTCSQSGTQSDGVANLLTLVSLFQGEDKRAEYDSAYTSTGIRYKELKEELATAIAKELAPIQEKRARLQQDTAYVDEVIATGAKKAQAQAQETIDQVSGALGFTS